MNLMPLPIVDVVDTGMLESGVFPCDKEGLVAVRDIPCIQIASPWHELDERMEEAGVTTSDYSMVFEKTGIVMELRLYEPYLHFQVVLPRPEYEDFYWRVRNTEPHMVVLVLEDSPEHMMLLTFDGEDDGEEDR